MTPKEAEYFLKIVELKSISKAADALFLSQPNLSRILMRLEDEFDVVFLDRSKLPLQLTRAGKLFAEYCQKVLNLHQDFKLNLSKGSSSNVRVTTLGVPPRRGGYILPLVIPLLKNLYPEVNIVIKEAFSDVIPFMVKSGEVDIGIFSLPKQPEGLQCDCLISESLLLMLPPEHQLYLAYANDTKSIPRLGSDLLPLLEGETFISLDSPKSITVRLINYLKTQGINCSISIKTKNNVMTYRLCEQGVGLAAIMEVDAHNTVFYQKPCLYEIGNPPLCEYWYVATRKGKKLTSLEQDLVQIIKECSSELFSSPIYCIE